MSRIADEAEARMDQFHREIAALPVLDPRRPDEILGYDEDGLPTPAGTGPACVTNGTAKNLSHREP